METIRNSQAIEGYYLPIMKRASNMESTYYAYKILKLIQPKGDYEGKIKTYVSNQELSTLSQNQTELLFYYRLNMELYGESEKCAANTDFIQKLKASLQENDLSNYYFLSQAFNSLETLNFFEEEVDEETREKFIEIIEKRECGKTVNDYLTECCDLLTLKLLNCNDIDGIITKKSERIKTMLTEGYSDIPSEYRLFCLYWGIRGLREWKIETAGLLDAEMIEAEILEHEKNAVYSISQEEYPCLEGTYYCLYIMQNIK